MLDHLAEPRVWKAYVSVHQYSIVDEICSVFKHHYWIYILAQACNNEEDETVGQVRKKSTLMTRYIAQSSLGCGIRINMVLVSGGKNPAVMFRWNIWLKCSTCHFCDPSVIRNRCRKEYTKLSLSLVNKHI